MFYFYNLLKFSFFLSRSQCNSPLRPYSHIFYNVSLHLFGIYCFSLNWYSMPESWAVLIRNGVCFSFNVEELAYSNLFISTFIPVHVEPVYIRPAVDVTIRCLLCSEITLVNLCSYPFQDSYTIDQYSTNPYVAGSHKTSFT